MDDWQMYQDVEKMLGEFKSKGLDDFVHHSRKGAIHSVEDPGNATSINTAALYRILRTDRSYCKSCTDAELEDWHGGVLKDDLERNVPSLDPPDAKGTD